MTCRGKCERCICGIPDGHVFSRSKGMGREIGTRFDCVGISFSSGAAIRLSPSASFDGPLRDDERRCDDKMACELDEAKSLMVEMACVEVASGCRASSCGCRNDQIVIPDHVSGNSQACPDAGMSMPFLGVGNNRQGGEKFAEIPLARRFMRSPWRVSTPCQSSATVIAAISKVSFRFRGKAMQQGKIFLFTPNDYVGVEKLLPLVDRRFQGFAGHAKVAIQAFASGPEFRCG